jgi:hypothetical protein
VRTRLRPALTPEQLAATYATPHDHRRFGRGHAERVARTVEMINDFKWHTVADLSCGNAMIASSVPGARLQLGDLAPGYPHEGPLEETLKRLEQVDLFILAETLEHLDDPDLVLRLVRRQARFLALSTPVDAWQDTNAEHYWAWSRLDVENMMRVAGFTVVAYDEVDSTAYGEPYKYGIWLCG